MDVNKAMMVYGEIEQDIQSAVTELIQLKKMILRSHSQTMDKVHKIDKIIKILES